MIKLYSGTPGSGKSLHAAQIIYDRYQWGHHTMLINMQVDVSYIRTYRAGGTVTQRDGYDLTPDDLIRWADKLRGSAPVREDQYLVIWDEAQREFNSRDFTQKGRMDWLKFFTLHRHYGIQVILIAQWDRMLDRQIRALIENEVVHRKMSNFGSKGKIITMLLLGELFIAVENWYPINEKIGVTYYRRHKRYARMYDTFYRVSDSGQISGDGGNGGPAPDGCPAAGSHLSSVQLAVLAVRCRCYELGITGFVLSARKFKVAKCTYERQRIAERDEDGLIFLD